MNIKKILGAVLFIIGVALVIISVVIKDRIGEGRLRVSDAQGQVDQRNSLFSYTPPTKWIGTGLTGSAQRRIDRGSDEILYYFALSNRCLGGGILLIVLGGVSFFFGRRKS